MVLTSCSGLNSCLEGTEPMCHKTNKQNHSGLVWLNDSLPESLVFTVLRVKAASFPLCLWEWNYLEVLQKAVAYSCYPLGNWEQIKPHLIFIRQVIIINWVTHSRKTTIEQSCGLWRSPLALRHSGSHTSLNLSHPEMRIGFPIQEGNKPTFAALW